MRRRTRSEPLDAFATVIEERLAPRAETRSSNGSAPAVDHAPQQESERPRLGEILIASGSLSDERLQYALAVQQESGARLGEVLVELGVITPEVLADALARQHALGKVDLRYVTPEAAALDVVAEQLARELHVLPLRLTDLYLEVAVADAAAVDVLRQESGRAVRAFLAPLPDIDQAIELWYTNADRVDQAVRAFESEASARFVETAGARVEVDENAPIVQVVTLILERASRSRASDVHLEPAEDGLRVRYRVDGALHDAMMLPSSMAVPLVSRIKVMAEMNIVERRRPQDGQFHSTVSGRELDVRVATSPNIYGEKCVLRLLDKSRALRHLSELGMPEDTIARFGELVHLPYGMVICAGPTGSGKTTTLYATVAEINRPDVNITTIEDPVEYVIPRVNQMQINEQAGITFAQGLRSILRQDPDVILVGEIRDVETARIAVQSALTGHFVMSSLHATDSIAALSRFTDMGIESFLIASSLVGIVAQRLVRRVCPSCQVPYEPTMQELAFYELAEGPENPQFFVGEGCNFCANTGYRERVGVYEVLRVTDTIRRLVVEHASNDEIRATAIKQGMRPLAQEAALLVANGTTTIAEVLRTIFVVAGD